MRRSIAAVFLVGSTAASMFGCRYDYRTHAATRLIPNSETYWKWCFGTGTKRVYHELN